MDYPGCDDECQEIVDKRVRKVGAVDDLHEGELLLATMFWCSSLRSSTHADPVSWHRSKWTSVASAARRQWRYADLAGAGVQGDYTFRLASMAPAPRNE